MLNAKQINVVLQAKIVSWLKSNLRDMCTSIDKNRCYLLGPADKKRRGKRPVRVTDAQQLSTGR